MNKKEFIKRLIDMGGCCAKPGTWARGWDAAISAVIKIANKLDEPQKPVIPQFVADYIEYYKATGITLGTWFNFVHEYEFERKTEEWIYSGSYEENLKREYLLIDAIRYGYEVEKEKKYYVLDHEGETMLYKVLSQGVAKTSGCKPSEVGKFLSRDYTFTETEIKAVDERYWAFAKPVEEVEE